MRNFIYNKIYITMLWFHLNWWILKNRKFFGYKIYQFFEEESVLEKKSCFLALAGIGLFQARHTHPLAKENSAGRKILFVEKYFCKDFLWNYLFFCIFFSNYIIKLKQNLKIYWISPWFRQLWRSSLFTKMKMKTTYLNLMRIIIFAISIG